MGKFIEDKKSEILLTLENTAKKMQSSRLKILKELYFVSEMIVEDPDGLASNKEYSLQCEFYGKQRAILKGRISADLAYFTFNTPIEYSTLFEPSFTIPNTSRCGYTFTDEELNPLPEYVYDINHRIFKINKDGEDVLATDFDINGIKTLLRDNNYDGSQNIEFTTSSTTYGSNILNIINYTGITKEPALLSYILVMDITNNSIVGFFNVTTEAMSLDSTWTATKAGTDSEYLESIMEVSTTEFKGLLGNYFNGIVPDDISLSVKNISNSSTPYDKINLSPMFPSPNFTILETMSDELPYYDNWNMVVEGSNVWGVYPKFKWEYKIKPDSFTEATIEGADGIFPSYITEIGSSVVNTNTYPVDKNQELSGENEITTEVRLGYIVDVEFTLLPIEEVSATEVVCGYNEIRHYIDDGKLSTIKNKLQELINLGNRVNLIEDTSIEDTAIITNSQAVINTIDIVVSTYLLADTTDYVEIADNTVPWDNMITAINNLGATARISFLETKLGTKESGYVSPLYSSANFLVNKSLGLLPALIQKVNSLDSLETTIIDLRTYYNNLP